MRRRCRALGVEAEFGVNLKRLREAAGLSQEEVGLRCGMQSSAVSRLERGNRNPRLTTIARLARAIEVPASALLEGIG
jgi:transcriptional regulator with XRE-family HTH domain